MIGGKDYKGQTFGQLTALYNTGEKNKNGSYIWFFRCSCGNHVKRDIGNTKHRKYSSRCADCNKQKMIEIKTTHGVAKSDKIYRTWCKIKERCFNINCPKYSSYGAIGISMYEPWITDFIKFKEYVGYPPKDGNRYSLDRIDNSVGYFPNNIRWANARQQARNKSKQKNNKSGVTGVHFHTSKGKHTETMYAVATWRSLDNKQRKKMFNCTKLGKETAFHMACEFRLSKLKELNQLGAGYSPKHGLNKIEEKQ